jgi:hypothetical protein
MLRVTKNVTSNATVVGEVKQSLRLPLTAKGEKVMDALAASGGVTQAVGKTTLQLSRGGESKQLPMQRLIEDPAQNILLEPGDVVTALYQPLSFTVLGATGKNEEINFEAQGISLAQGLIESRAGNSKLAKQNKNHFGIKCFSKKCVKGHCSNHCDDHHKDFFRIFKSSWESWRAHSVMISSGRYASLKKNGRDYKKWAHGLKRLGYATDRTYAEKLIGIIERYKLNRYDHY